MLRKPCIDCGAVTPGGTRCNNCQGAHTRKVNAKQTAARRITGRPQYSGDYTRHAANIRATATICWLCGDGPRPNDPWQADHIIQANNRAGEVGTDGGLAPAHRSCNIARSNRARATGGTTPHPGQNMGRNSGS